MQNKELTHSQISKTLCHDGAREGNRNKAANERKQEQGMA